MKYFVLILFLFLFGKNSFASINIDSLKIKPSTCLNNGSVKIYASGTNAPFFYRLVSGPTTRLLQSADTFTSLPSGNYLLRIYNANFDSTQTNFIVGGNYLLPDFTINFQSPICKNDSSGVISAGLILGTGNNPFTFTLFNNSVGNSISNTIGYFNNLKSGNYTLRLTDSCNNFTSKNVTLLNGNSTFTYYSSVFSFIGCDTIVAEVNFSANSSIVKGFINTKYGNRIAKISAYSSIFDTIPNLTYGDTLHIMAINLCNDTVTKMIIVEPTIYHLWNIPSTANCLIRNNYWFYFKGSFPLKPYYTQYTIKNGINTTLKFDTTYTFFLNQYLGNSNVFSSNSNDTVFARTTDACGNQYYDTLIPVPLITSVSAFPNNLGCLDSTCNVNFNTNNFLSGTTLKITSGPAIIKSTKPKFAYSDSISYNKPFYFKNGSFDLDGFGPGKYYYNISDSCGNSVSDSFQIYPNQVSNWKLNINTIKGCIGQNKIYYTINYPYSFFSYPFTIDIIDLNNGGIVYISAIHKEDSVLSLNNHSFQFNANFTSYYPKINKTLFCPSIHDTIIIPSYNPPKISNYGNLFCNGNWYVDLIPDSSFGVPPFNYEVISGPTTYPLQPSSTFLFTKPGVYLARIVDACGSGSTYNFTADTTLKFAILQNGNLCGGGRVVFKCHSSPYFTYHWKLNNALINIGDSLVFNPFHVSDTGIYKITKYVNFNGCKDSVTVDLYLKNFYTSTDYHTICQGESLLWRNNYYTTSTFFSDTIFGINSCDSFFNLNLIVNPKTFSSLNTAICQGTTYQTPSGKILSSGGLYYDTIPNSKGCDSIITIQLYIKNNSGSSVNSTICQNQNYILPNGNAVNQSGIYIDTLTNYNGCDSIVKTYLTVLKMNRDTVHASICDNSMYQLPNGSTTNVAGIYTDSFINYVGCDSIIITHLSVLQYPSISFPNFVPICIGNTITLNAFVPNATYQWNDLSTSSNHAFTNTGNYWVIISNPPCKADTANVSLNFIDCNCRMIAPNAFTPNDDGIDDLFKPMSTCDLNIINYHFKIYNRLGQLVFSTNDINASWNGTYKSLPQEVSTYSYIVEWTNPTTNQIEITKGNLNLIR